MYLTIILKEEYLMLSQFMLWLKTFVIKDEEAQTLVEYALIIALIAIVLIAAIGTLSGGIGNIFEGIGNRLSDEAANAQQ
jgi:pilus assembly protein Flp/PilA